MTFRRAARTDENQPEIVKEFRKLGWYVLIVSQLKNCCDIIVSKAGRTVAVEIKNPDLPPSKQKLTKGELEFSKEWQGEFCLVKTVEDVAAVDNLLKDGILSKGK